VAIARSLIGEPTLVLGDEPMGEVDTGTAEMLLTLMRRIHRERRVTFLIVTHDLDLAAKADRIIHLRDGHLAGDERVESVRSPVAAA
jgi:ABC-type lipoprotein export system ATPase subunit